jgi:hypothetical protein
MYGRRFETFHSRFFVFYSCLVTARATWELAKLSAKKLTELHSIHIRSLEPQPVTMEEACAAGILSW